MAAMIVTPSMQAIRLPWESENFGFPVARLSATGATDGELWSALMAARQEKIALVVLTASPDRVIEADLLQAFGGVLADRKALFSRTLDHGSKATNAACTATITKYDESVPSTALFDLAIASGVYSRFRVDPRFPRASFEMMYRIWIARSVRGEIADVVLVDQGASDPEVLRGFVTVSKSQQVGKIGLIAVDERARGQGVGRRLLEAAHGWMGGQGLTAAEVVTQLANEAACGLYRSAGYRLAAVENYYHLWPQADSEAV